MIRYLILILACNSNYGVAANVTMSAIELLDGSKWPELSKNNLKDFKGNWADRSKFGSRLTCEGPWWGRFTVNNKASQAIEIYFVDHYYLTNDLDYYFPGNGQWQKGKVNVYSGKRSPFHH